MVFACIICVVIDLVFAAGNVAPVQVFLNESAYNGVTLKLTGTEDMQCMVTWDKMGKSEVDLLSPSYMATLSQDFPCVGTYWLFVSCPGTGFTHNETFDISSPVLDSSVFVLDFEHIIPILINTSFVIQLNATKRADVFVVNEWPHLNNEINSELNKRQWDEDTEFSFDNTIFPVPGLYLNTISLMDTCSKILVDIHSVFVVQDFMEMKDAFIKVNVFTVQLSIVVIPASDITLQLKVIDLNENVIFIKYVFCQRKVDSLALHVEKEIIPGKFGAEVLVTSMVSTDYRVVSSLTFYQSPKITTAIWTTTTQPKPTTVTTLTTITTVDQTTPSMETASTSPEKTTTNVETTETTEPQTTPSMETASTSPPKTTTDLETTETTESPTTPSMETASTSPPKTTTDLETTETTERQTTPDMKTETITAAETTTDMETTVTIQAEITTTINTEITLDMEPTVTSLTNATSNTETEITTPSDTTPHVETTITTPGATTVGKETEITTPLHTVLNVKTTATSLLSTENLFTMNPICFSEMELKITTNQDHPRMEYITSEFEVSGNLDFSSCKTDFYFQFKWVFHVVMNDDQTSVAYSRRTHNPTITIEANTLDVGFYKCVLEACIVSSQGNCKENFTHIEIVPHPPTAIIRGVRKRIVQYDNGPFVLDARGSLDPVGDLPSVRIQELIESWECSTADTGVLTETMVNAFLVNTNYDNMLNEQGILICGGKTDHTSKSFTLDHREFGVNRWFLICYSMVRASSSSKDCVALKVIHWSVPDISIECITNCLTATCRKIRHDNLQIDASLRGNVSNSLLVTYQWFLYQWTAGLNGFSDTARTLEGSDGIGLNVPKSAFEPGQLYMINVEVNVPGMVTASASELYRVRMPPYGGTCSVDKLNGTAALDQFCVICSGWRDEASMTLIASDYDMDRFIHYDILQTINRPVSKYILIENSAARRNCFYLHDGHFVNFETHIQVRVKGMCKDSTMWTTPVFIYPPFDASRISTVNDANATETIFEFVKETDTRIVTSLENGSTGVILNQIGTLFSSLQNIKVQKGEVLLQIDQGNGSAGTRHVDIKDTLTAEKALTNFLEPDPTENITYKVQEMKEKYAVVLEQMIDQVVVDGLVWNATMLTQFAETLHTLLDGPTDTITNTTKQSVLNALSDVTRVFDSIVANDDPEITETADALVNLLGIASTVIVPVEMQSVIGTVQDLKTARQYNNVLLNLATEEEKGRREMDDKTSDERNFLLFKLQQKYTFHVDEDRLMVQKLTDFMDELSTSMTKLKMCTGCSMNFGKTGVDMTIKRSRATDLSKTGVTIGNTTLTAGVLNDLKNPTVTLVVGQSTRNPFLSGSGKENIAAFVTSPVTTVVVENMLNASLGEIIFSQTQQREQYYHVNQSVDEEDASQMVVASIWKSFASDYFCVSIKMSSDIRGYWVYLKHGSRPTIIDYDFKEYFSDDRKNALCFSTGKAGWLFYGLAVDITGSILSRKDPPYDIAVATLSCLSYNKAEQQWGSGICILQSVSHDFSINCLCRILEDLVFASTFYAAPNSIDFSTVFLRFSPQDQVAVLITMLFSPVLYILVLIWARRQDKQDSDKWAIRPLVDCDPVDNYYYVMRVYTGKRPGSGTTSKVGFVLMGKYVCDTSTNPRELSDGYRKGFSTGSVMNFMLSTSRCLGQLEYLRIWHDNSGEGQKASWYLYKVEIIDVQAQKSYIFRADRWLSVEYKEGFIGCTLPVSHEGKKTSRKHGFLDHVEENFHDEHIWLSVFYRPSPSNFTRAQRWSCGFVFLMTTMLADAMFYRDGDNYETPAPLKIGPFEFSFQQVYISVMCCLITTPTLLLTCLFRLSEKKISDNGRKTAKNKTKPESYMINESCIDGERDGERVVQDYGNIHFIEGYSKTTCRFPSWIRSIAWFIFFSVTVTSGFFVILYSMEWGKQKSEQWLTTFFLAFFNSCIIIDTIRVSLLVLLFTFVFGKKQGPSVAIQRKAILGQYPACLRLNIAPQIRTVPVLSTIAVKEARLSREKERNIRKSLLSVLVRILLLTILFGISYNNRDEHAFYLHKDIVNKLLSPGKSESFENISSMYDYFRWLNQTAIPNLFPENDSYGQRLHWRLREYMGGSASYRMGPPRLRQLRTKTRPCKIPYIGKSECADGYMVRLQDTNSYCIGWKKAPCNPKDRLYKFSSSAWKYTSPSGLWGFPIKGFLATYNDGGYISRLDVNKDVSIRIINELYQRSWLDKQTRSVTLEFTLYNANVNMFVYNVFMIEFGETGGAVPFYMILPMRIHHHFGHFGQYILLFEILFLVFMLTSLIQLIFAVWKEKLHYFAHMDVCYNICFLLLGLITIGLYVNRLLLAEQALAEFKKDPKEFVTLYKTAFWDLIFIVCLGGLNFTALVKVIGLLGYGKRVGSVVQVCKSAAAELFWCSFLFTYCYIVYGMFGYLLFGANLQSYMSLYRSLTTLFLSLIGKNKFTEAEATNPVTAKLYFLVFVVFVVYIVLTMFLAVWSTGVTEARYKANEGSVEEVIQYIIDAVKSILGYRMKSRKGSKREKLRQSRREEAP